MDKSSTDSSLPPAFQNVRGQLHCSNRSDCHIALLETVWHHDTILSVKTKSVSLHFGWNALFVIIPYIISRRTPKHMAAPMIANQADRFPKKAVVRVCVLLCIAFAADPVCCGLFGFHSGAGVGGTLCAQ